MYLNEGDIYDGEWKNDKAEGKGTKSKNHQDPVRIV